jgi:hypothetical protein
MTDDLWDGLEPSEKYLKRVDGVVYLYGPDGRIRQVAP